MHPLVPVLAVLSCLNTEISDVRLLQEYRISRYAPVATVSLAADGGRGCAADENYNLILFDRHGFVNLTTKHTLDATAASMAPDGTQLALAGSANRLAVLGTETLKPVATKPMKNTVRRLDWLPSGKYLIAAMDEEEHKALLPWDGTHFGAATTDLKIPAFEQLVFAPDRDAFLFSVQPDRWRYVRAAAGRFRQHDLDFATRGVRFVTVLGLSRTGVMVTAEDNRSHLRSVAAPDQRTALPDDFSRASQFLGGTPHYAEVRGQSLRFTNVATGRRHVKALGGAAAPTVLCCAASGTALAVGFEDGWVHLYEVRMRFGVPR
ncbi:hypothetical protein GobsT_13340 [Gemmata obscuriglobus]|uniref:WD40 repeat domain-containing protein n=1 Tax=Gemmata obscuriglobus TaxID=114 RepID=A0A2Z3H381_9BACT|nr:hypothetical protein [Gemmata obscuriglobus]AWM40218.1 hypothetical protein C1280_26575 [Gemmata obscuriglobus]QEG26592.1 hypothetical protein GobsT_13340 [Gemmata obscuriglobus]VTS02065.1 hypothetical protein : [Gemmata obscuriglobus UQM 2246]